MNRFKNLKKGWDGYNAEPISDVVINRSEKLKRILSDKFQIFPTGRNSIQFELTDGDYYIEFEVFEDKTVIFEIDSSTKSGRRWECL